MLSSKATSSPGAFRTRVLFPASQTPGMGRESPYARTSATAETLVDPCGLERKISAPPLPLIPGVDLTRQPWCVLTGNESRSSHSSRGDSTVGWNCV